MKNKIKYILINNQQIKFGINKSFRFITKKLLSTVIWKWYKDFYLQNKFIEINITIYCYG